MSSAGRWRWLVAAFAGAAAVLGFAPTLLYPIPVLSLALLFWLWRGADARSAFWLGLMFGLGFFLVGVSWVFVSLHTYGGMPAILAAIATFLFCAVLALFPAIAGWLSARLNQAGPWTWALGAASLWVLTEWLRSWVLTGFPWLSMGYAHVPASPLAGYAPVLGIFGVSFAAALSAAGLSIALRQRAWLLLLAPLALWLGGWALAQLHWTQPQGEPLKVSLLQGNVPQDLKFRDEHLVSILRTYAELTQQSRAKLIVLPESALPIFRDQVPPDYLELLAQHARGNGGDLLVGMFQAEGSAIHNSMFSLGTAPSQSYSKHHLVPFGEFIPLRWLIGWIYDDLLNMPLADQAAGPARQQPMAIAGQRVAVNICYEDAFGNEIIRQLPEASLLVNVTNDGWFGRSFGPQQHLQIAQARSLETGRYMLRATNTGVSAIIDQRGNIVARAPEFQVTSLHGQAQGYGGATPYVRWGNYPIVSLVALLLLWCALRRARTA